MADQSYGLRFDIYERVHLAEEVVGIQELVELEILPRIEVIPGDEYASLRGHLHVSGLYRGEDGTQELSHLIPVEITVPLSRVNRLEDITVEIENFDVDVLGSHSLNITGVLSLRGIETVAFVPGTEDWSNKEYSVAHEAETKERETIQTEAAAYPEYAPVSNDRPAAEPYWALPEIQEQKSDTSLWTKDREAVNPLISSAWADKESGNKESITWLAEEPRIQEQEQEQQELPQEADQIAAAFIETPIVETTTGSSEVPAIGPVNVWHLEQPDGSEVPLEEGDRIYTAEEYLENVQEQESTETTGQLADEGQAQAEDRPEMKIALGSKKSSDTSGLDHVPLSSLLQSGRPPREAEVTEALQQEGGEEDQADRENVRWKSLFISNVQEQTPFRQVKLVIVQREETIDVIADRYQINPRELLLYNRLSEQSLEEGQVLYIP